MPPTKPDLVGSAEACEILGIDRGTLSRWVSAGKLDYWVRLAPPNGAMLFERSAVKAAKSSAA